MRRLTSAQPKSACNYLSRAQSLFDHHRVPSKLQHIKDNWNLLDKQDRSDLLNKLDNETKDLLLNTENSVDLFA